MTIIKTIQQQRILKKIRIKYNPNKRIQYVFVFRNKGYYFKNIKETYLGLFKLILSVVGVIITAPFLIIWGIKGCLTSLLPYSLVYTRKHLKDDPLVVSVKLKEGDYMNANEAFKVLGMEKKFPISEEQLSKAYRAKAKEVHPDITGKDEEMKKLMRLMNG